MPWVAEPVIEPAAPIETVLRLIQPKVDPKSKEWKKSRKRPGYLIRRIPGYDISEDEYGASYLFVVSRRGGKKSTSADPTQYEHAGFFNWATLEVAGRMVKEEPNE